MSKLGDPLFTFWLNNQKLKFALPLIFFSSISLCGCETKFEYTHSDAYNSNASSQSTSSNATTSGDANATSGDTGFTQSDQTSKSGRSSSSSTSSAPGKVPTELQFTFDQNGRATLSWSPIPGAMFYNVKSASAENGPYGQYTTSNSASFTFETPISGDTHFFVVSAFDFSGEHEDSLPIQYIVPAGSPSSTPSITPSNLPSPTPSASPLPPSTPPHAFIPSPPPAAVPLRADLPLLATSVQEDMMDLYFSHEANYYSKEATQQFDLNHFQVDAQGQPKHAEREALRDQYLNSFLSPQGTTVDFENENAPERLNEPGALVISSPQGSNFEAKPVEVEIWTIPTQAIKNSAGALKYIKAPVYVYRLQQQPNDPIESPKPAIIYVPGHSELPSSATIIANCLYLARLNGSRLGRFCRLRSAPQNRACFSLPCERFEFG